MYFTHESILESKLKLLKGHHAQHQVKKTTHLNDTSDKMYNNRDKYQQTKVNI